MRKNLAFLPLPIFMGPSQSLKEDKYDLGHPDPTFSLALLAMEVFFLVYLVILEQKRLNGPENVTLKIRMLVDQSVNGK